MKACPDTLYGQHGPPGRDGRCGWCGLKVAGPVPRDRTALAKWREGDGQDPLAIEPDVDGDYHDQPDQTARPKLSDTRHDTA